MKHQRGTCESCQKTQTFHQIGGEWIHFACIWCTGPPHSAPHVCHASIQHDPRRLLAAGNICHAQDNTTAPAAAAIDTQTARDDRPGWFRDARFGMFVHWGP